MSQMFSAVSRLCPESHWGGKSCLWPGLSEPSSIYWYWSSGRWNLPEC